MKKFLPLLLVMMLLAVPAMAEITMTTEEVGRQSMSGVDAVILRVDFAGEKEIPSLYVLAQDTWLTEDDGLVELVDVNFDGHDDLVVTTAVGASNAVYAFYLWDEAAGAFETEAQPEVWNYQLYPAQGLVLSHGTSGWAGLLHESRVYGWKEGKLTQLRSSVWDTLVESDSQQDGDFFKMVERYDESVMVETYMDYENGAETVESFPSADYQNDDTFASQRFLYEDEFLQLDALTEDSNDGSNG